MIFIIKLAAVLTIALELLKITGVIKVSWKYVLLPTIAVIILCILCVAGIYMFIKII